MTHKKNKKSVIGIIFALFAIAIAMILFAATALAQNTQQTAAKNNDGFTITPSSINGLSNSLSHGYTIEIAPGNLSENFAYIKNFADKPVHFSLYGADPTVSNTGSPAYKTHDQSISGPGTWVKFDQPEIDLNPSEERNVRFIVSVPKNTPPGDYRAGITMEKGKVNSNVPGISISTRMVSQAKIEVTGTAQAASTETGAVETQSPKQPPLWTTYYFWISCVLFIISLVLLVWALLHEKKPKTAQSHRVTGHTAARQPARKKTAVRTVRNKHGRGK